jgi:hypothetical protein
MFDTKGYFNLYFIDFFDHFSYSLSPSLSRCFVCVGTGLDRSVVVVQSNGQLSSSLITLSYQTCNIGTIPLGLDCINCTQGRYNPIAGATTCLVRNNVTR